MSKNISGNKTRMSPIRNTLRKLNSSRKSSPRSSSSSETSPRVRVEHHQLYSLCFKEADYDLKTCIKDAKTLKFVARILVIMDRIDEGLNRVNLYGEERLFDNFIKYLDQNPLDLYLASVDGKDVGYMITLFNGENIYEILEVVVYDDQIREQIVKRLFNKMTEVSNIYLNHNGYSRGYITTGLYEDKDIWDSLNLTSVNNDHRFMMNIGSFEN
jgi:hypothetical protein